MAGTTIVTYSSNHNGSINFYKDPNHYAIDGAVIGQEEKEELHQRFTKEYKKISE